MNQKPSTFVSGIEIKLSGYVPGAIGRITELHATYYKQHWDFDLFFESKVATELSEFLEPIQSGSRRILAGNDGRKDRGRSRH